MRSPLASEGKQRKNTSYSPFGKFLIEYLSRCCRSSHSLLRTQSRTRYNDSMSLISGRLIPPSLPFIYHEKCIAYCCSFLSLLCVRLFCVCFCQQQQKSLAEIAFSPKRALQSPQPLFPQHPRLLFVCSECGGGHLCPRHFQSKQ